MTGLLLLADMTSEQRGFGEPEVDQSLRMPIYSRLLHRRPLLVIILGRRKRVRLRASATFGTGADGGSGSTEPEDREVGGSQEMNSNQEGSAAKSFEDPEDEGEYYSLLGLDVGATPQAIKVRHALHGF